MTQPNNVLNTNDMNNEEKVKKIVDSVFKSGFNTNRSFYDMAYNSALEMARWKDEQYKTAYVVTRSDLHYDEVEKVFFNKAKAEEYCKSYNANANSFRRNITEIEVSL